MPRPLLLTVMLALAAACRQAEPVPVPSGPVPVAGNVVVTVAATGVDPHTLHVLAGSTVSFVNQDSRPHQFRSDPHPAHAECALMNVEAVAPGGMVQTSALAVGQGCGFHDEADPLNPAFQGFVLAH